MMDAFVDIKNTSGTKTGGPFPVTSWTATRRVDRAGSFEFSTPLNGTATAAIVLKATAEIYAYVGGSYELVGAGVIDSIEQAADPDSNIVMLRVSGDDQMRELAYRTMGDTLLAQDDILGDWESISNLSTTTDVHDVIGMSDGALLVAQRNNVSGWSGNSYISRYDNGVWTATYALAAGGGGGGFYDLLDLGSGVILAGNDAALGVLRSTDFGKTWTSIALDTILSMVAVSSATVLAGNISGTIYKSTDGGLTWDAGTSTGISGIVNGLISLGSGVILAGVGSTGLARSTNTGATWSAVTVPGGVGVIYCFVSPSTNIVLAGTLNGYVMRSTDNGVTFSAGVQLTGTSLPIYQLVMLGTYVLASGGEKVWISDDNGVSFSEVVDLNCGDGPLGLTVVGDAAVASGPDGAVWRGTTIVIGISHAAAVAAVGALAPAGWTFNADGSPGNDSIYIQFAGETVLAAALLVAERSRGHVYLSAARTLTFADTWTASGVHAVAPLLGQPLAAEVCGIADLAVAQASYDLVTRIYPRTRGGIGIASSTVAPGTGYTKDTTNEYVQHTAAVTAYGVIEAWVIFEDIADPEEVTAAATVEIADALVRAAVTWLEQRRAIITNYRLKLLGCSVLLQPLQTLRVSYMQSNWMLDQTLNILETTWAGDERGIVTTDVVVGDSAYWIDDEEATVARAVARVNSLAAR